MPNEISWEIILLWNESEVRLGNSRYKSNQAVGLLSVFCLFLRTTGNLLFSIKSNFAQDSFLRIQERHRSQTSPTNHISHRPGAGFGLSLCRRRMSVSDKHFAADQHDLCRPIIFQRCATSSLGFTLCISVTVLIGKLPYGHQALCLKPRHVCNLQHKVTCR